MKTKFAFVALLGLLAGCGGGDTVFYEVLFGSAVAGTDCTNGQTPTVTVNDTTFTGASTVSLITGPDGKLYLDAGKMTLEGTKTGNTGSFAGQYQKVDTGAGTTKTTTDKTSVSTTFDGATISGSVTQVHLITCVAGANNCGATWKDQTCTTTTNFKGREVKNVQYQHGI